MTSALPRSTPATTGHLVPTQHRNMFLSQMFGYPDNTHFESLIYNWGQTFIVDAKLDYWECVTLSNQGLYLFPGRDPAHLVHLKIAGSGFDEAIPSHAAGIVVSCVALSHLHHMGSERANRLYQKLSDYFQCLPAARQISRALQGMF